MKYKALIIIPTFNEKDNILIMLNKIRQLNIEEDILVIDDNSPDGTSDVVNKYNDDGVFLITRDKKLGLGSAYTLGFEYAISNDYKKIIQIDSDLSHDPKNIIDLLDASNKYDVVIGSRYIDGIRIINWPISRLFLSYFANLYSRKIIGFNIFDSTGGFKCINTNALKNINLNKINSEGYSFQIEINFLLWLKKFSIKEIPIIFSDRKIGDSKMSKKIIFEAVLMVPLLRLKKMLRAKFD